MTVRVIDVLQAVQIANRDRRGIPVTLRKLAGLRHVALGQRGPVVPLGQCTGRRIGEGSISGPAHQHQESSRVATCLSSVDPRGDPHSQNLRDRQIRQQVSQHVCIKQTRLRQVPTEVEVLFPMGRQLGQNEVMRVQATCLRPADLIECGVRPTSRAELTLDGRVVQLRRSPDEETSRKASTADAASTSSSLRDNSRPMTELSTAASRRRDPG